MTTPTNTPTAATVDEGADSGTTSPKTWTFDEAVQHCKDTYWQGKERCPLRPTASDTWSSIDGFRTQQSMSTSPQWKLYAMVSRETPSSKPGSRSMVLEVIAYHIDERPHEVVA